MLTSTELKIERIKARKAKANKWATIAMCIVLTVYVGFNLFLILN